MSIFVKLICETYYTSSNGYLADINQQAEEMFTRLVKQMAERESVTEQLKTDNQLEWVQKMNNIRNRAMEIAYTDLIYI